MSGNESHTAVLDMLAACREQITRLDAREASHHTTASGQLAEIGGHLTGLSQTLQDHAATLARLTDATSADVGGYCPAPMTAGRWVLPSTSS